MDAVHDEEAIGGRQAGELAAMRTGEPPRQAGEALAGAFGLGVVATACGAARDQDTGSGPTAAKDSSSKGAKGDLTIDMKDI
ncbi:MAG: hypothetical protein M3Q43_03685, partial [Actinomycetota bacterium]|nr:hypothetical protein [Actinomycetota bacterium]